MKEKHDDMIKGRDDCIRKEKNKNRKKLNWMKISQKEDISREGEENSGQALQRGLNSPDK